jgi:hypothetical protein
MLSMVFGGIEFQRILGDIWKTGMSRMHNAGNGLKLIMMLSYYAGIKVDVLTISATTHQAQLITFLCKRALSSRN